MASSIATHYPVIIVGGGQAGLSVSYCLQQRGIGNVVLEKHSVAYSWQAKRWDSFCLVTPNWQCALPGYKYSGDDPYGFMEKDKIVQYVKDYANSFGPDVREGISVEKVERDGSRSVFEIATSAGSYTADQVVVATGGYHTPKVPRMSEALPQNLLQLHSSEYKRPADLPDGSVLVVGTGQSGCQIAEDLHIAGRQVHLCVGGAPRSPREYRGKDVVEWLDQLGYYEITVEEHPQKEAVRKKTNHYVTGRGGGREIDLRLFATEGMQLYGKLKSIEGNRLALQDDLQKNLDQADEVAESIKRTIDTYIEKNNIDAVEDPPYRPVWQPHNPPTALNLQSANINTVIWATGYHMDFSWIAIPAFDGSGYPTHQRGVSAVIEGLYFVGLPWLYTWGSGRFSGVALDADYIADCIALRHRGERLTEYSRYGAINEVAIGS